MFWYGFEAPFHVVTQKICVPKCLANEYEYVTPTRYGMVAVLNV